MTDLFGLVGRKKTAFGALVGATLLASCAVNLTPSAEPAAYRLDNGLWYQDGEFVPKIAHIVDGQLRFGAGDLPAIETIDLAGGHVVPPYCEGHNHNLGGSDQNVEEVVNAYLKDGIFYAMMPGSFRYYRDRIEGRLNKPQSLDVSFANNGLTGAGGHPRGLRESLKKRFGLYPEFTQEALADKGYFEADTLEEVRAKFALILAEKPDLVKVMLYLAEDYKARKDDPETYGRRGLYPALMPEVVRLARDAGLRVAVHVESEYDMVTAIEAGADIIAHLPPYDEVVTLSEETVQLAATSQVALITTFSLAQRVRRRDEEKYQAILAAQRANLQRLAKAGANLVVGSDNTQATSRFEAEHLQALGAVDNRTLLNMWTVNCAQMVFPKRKIGQLADGYEASFLVLDGNPLDKFEHTGAIRLRFKDGEKLELAEKE